MGPVSGMDTEHIYRYLLICKQKGGWADIWSKDTMIRVRDIAQDQCGWTAVLQNDTHCGCECCVRHKRCRWKGDGVPFEWKCGVWCFGAPFSVSVFRSGPWTAVTSTTG